MELSEYDRNLIKLSKKLHFTKPRQCPWIFHRKDVKTILDNFNELMKTSTDEDENGIAERQELLIQQRMSATLTTLFSAWKELPYTKQRKK